MDDTPEDKDAQIRDLQRQLIHWRNLYLGQVKEQSDLAQSEIKHLRSELEAHKETLSWRITEPLRKVQQARMSR